MKFDKSSFTKHHFAQPTAKVNSQRHLSSKLWTKPQYQSCTTALFIKLFQSRSGSKKGKVNVTLSRSVWTWTWREILSLLFAVALSNFLAFWLLDFDGLVLILYTERSCQILTCCTYILLKRKGMIEFWSDKFELFVPLPSTFFSNFLDN